MKTTRYVVQGYDSEGNLQYYGNSQSGWTEHFDQAEIFFNKYNADVEMLAMHDQSVSAMGCELVPVYIEMARQYWVNLYLTDRVYGGPEEGGWYYNAGEAVVSFECTEGDQEELLTEAHELVEWLNEGRPQISSVLSEGQYSALAEEGPGVSYPEEEPHYE